MEIYKNDDNCCPYVAVCFFKQHFLSDYEDFCKNGFTSCARFKRGCLKGINEVPDNMKPIDYTNI